MNYTDQETLFSLFERSVTALEGIHECLIEIAAAHSVKDD